MALASKSLQGKEAALKHLKNCHGKDRVGLCKALDVEPEINESMTGVTLRLSSQPSYGL